METDLFSILSDFIKKEKIKVKQQRVSDVEFWFDSPDESLTIKFIIDVKAHKILYDIYLTNLYIHLKEETLRDVEKLESISREHHNWKLEEPIENLWRILDRIKLWAEINGFELIEKGMI